jgi:cytochrome c oxidase cbb3-type subunit 1
MTASLAALPTVFSIGLQRQLAYRWNYLLRALFSAMPLLVSWVFWKAVFQGKETVGPYTLASLQGVLSALRSFSEVAHFTHHTVAHAHLGMYAFFAMVMFGSMYYILPRITGREWPSNALISVHFWGVAIGIVLYVVVLSAAGLQQGRMMNDPTVKFLDVVKFTIPYLQIRTVSGLLLALGHAAFVVNFGWLLVRMFAPYRKPVVSILAGAEIASPSGK